MAYSRWPINDNYYILMTSMFSLSQWLLKFIFSVMKFFQYKLWTYVKSKHYVINVTPNVLKSIAFNIFAIKV